MALMVYDGTKAYAGHRSRGITEADLSLPLWGLAWIATLLLLNTARTLGDLSGMYRLTQNAMSVLFSITVLLRLTPVDAKSPCILELVDFILTYNSASCGDNPACSTELTRRTVSAHYHYSVGRRTLSEVYLGVGRAPNAKSRIWLVVSRFRLDHNGCAFRRCRFCFVMYMKVRRGF